MPQRNTVMNLGWPDSASPTTINGVVRRALIAAGLLRPIGKSPGEGYELTPVGVVVRELILKEQQA